MSSFFFETTRMLVLGASYLKISTPDYAEDGTGFVTALYQLEGDGILVLNCYKKKSEVPFRLVTTRLCKLLLGRPSTLQQQSITYNLDMIIFKLNYKKALRIQWQHSRQPDCSNLPKSVKLNQLQQILMTSRLSFSLVPRPHPARISLPV